MNYLFFAAVLAVHLYLTWLTHKSNLQRIEVWEQFMKHSNAMIELLGGLPTGPPGPVPRMVVGSELCARQTEDGKWIIQHDDGNEYEMESFDEVMRYITEHGAYAMRQMLDDLD